MGRLVGVGANHGGLVDYEKCVGAFVLSEDGADGAEGIDRGAVDTLMDCVCVLPGVARQDLGRTACRRQELGADAEVGRRLDKGRDEGGLAGAGVSAEDESRAGVRIEKEVDDRGASLPLVGGRDMGEEGEYQLFDSGHDGIGSWGLMGGKSKEGFVSQALGNKSL